VYNIAFPIDKQADASDLSDTVCAVVSHSNPVRSLFLLATSLSSDALHRACRIAIRPKEIAAH
jgi:hypothetical protein